MENLSKRAAADASFISSSTAKGQLLLNKSYPAYVSSSSLSPTSRPIPSLTLKNEVAVTVEGTERGIAPRPLEILFLKPRLLMNISGPAVLTAARSFLPSPLASYRIITIQDDLDLPSLSLKPQRGGSPRGHNGVRSVSTSLAGSRDFHRLRIGIGRPAEKKDSISDWVLGPLTREEVRACEFDEERGKAGSVLEAVWREVLKIGWED